MRVNERGPRARAQRWLFMQSQELAGHARVRRLPRPAGAGRIAGLFPAWAAGCARPFACRWVRRDRGSEGPGGDQRARQEKGKEICLTAAFLGGGAALGPPRRAGRRRTGGGDVSGSRTGLCPIPGERLRVSGGAPRLRLLPAPRSGGLPSPQAEGLHLSGFIQGGLPCSGEEAEGDPAKPPEAEQMPKEGGGPEIGLPPAGPPQRNQQQHDRH